MATELMMGLLLLFLSVFRQSLLVYFAAASFFLAYIFGPGESDPWFMQSGVGLLVAFSVYRVFRGRIA